MNAGSSEMCVTEWLGQLKAGDGEAARKLWERYFTELVRLARKQLRAASRAVADEEDAALSAFKSFCKAAEAGRFPQLNDRHDLWQVLVMLTRRKAASLARHEKCQKRGGGHVVLASELAGASDDAPDPLAGVCGGEPTPEFAALVADECKRLLDKLEDDDLRKIANLKMEGYTNAEVAKEIGRVEGTVERKLALIRTIWDAETPS